MKKEPSFREILKKIAEMKFREIENLEDLDRYNNKKLGFYSAIRMILDELQKS